MPVENDGFVFPAANVQFDAQEGPVTVEADAGTAHTGLVEPGDVAAPGDVQDDTSVTVDHSEMHEATSLDRFEVPGPETVAVEGFAGTGAEAADEPVPAAAEVVEETDPAAAPDAAVEEAAGRHEAPDTKTADGAQAKVVAPPAGPAAEGTPGVEVK